MGRGQRTTDYVLHGLQVRSAVALDARRSADQVAPDVWIDWAGPAGAWATEVDDPVGRQLALVEIAGRRLARTTQHDRGYRIDYPAAASVEISPGLDAMTVNPRCGQERVASLLVAGGAMSTLLTLRGHLVLHASAVSVDRKAIALIGPSGAGKSTLAGALCAAGAQLVTDDSLRVDTTGSDPVVCHPGGTSLRLRAGSTVARRISDRLGGAGRSVDGRLLARPTPAGPGALELAAMVKVDRRSEASPGAIARLKGADALAAVASNPRTLGVTDPRLLKAHLEQSAELARTVPVLVLAPPPGTRLTEMSSHLLDSLLSAAA